MTTPTHKSALTKQRTVVLLALAGGNSKAAAAGKAGVSPRTLRRWQADDPDFADSVDVAMGAGRALYEDLLREAGTKDWRAALAAYEAIYLFPLGRKAGTAAPDGGTVVVEQVGPVLLSPTPEQLGRVLEILTRAAGGDITAVAATLARNAARQVGSGG